MISTETYYQNPRRCKMNSSILTEIKRLLSKRLDEKAYQIIKLKGTYLSKHDIDLLINFMNKKGLYSLKVLYYIYYVSQYRDRFDPGANDNAIIWKASENGHVEVVRLLFEDKRITQTGLNDAISVARKKGHSEIVGLLTGAVN